MSAIFELTVPQWESMHRVCEKWDSTPIPEEDIEIIPTIPNDGYYLGMWVGEPMRGNPGRIYLGIERDGYTHS